jgi:uncharacterized membrane protein YhaH (DUF805 family)
MQNYINVLKKYAVFSGRSSRREYWMFFLVNLLISIVIGIIQGSLGSYGKGNINLLSTLYSLAIFIPNIALGVRRMHDVGKSGWFLLIPIYNFILTLTSGTVGDNKYGPDPKLA